MSIREKFEILDSKAYFDYKTFNKIRRWSTAILFTIILIFYPNGELFAPILSVLYYNLFRVLCVDMLFEKYIYSLEKDIYPFFRLLNLSLDNGNNLEHALDLVDHALPGDLSNMFKKALIELRFGKDLKEVLVGLSEKIPSKMLKEIILLLANSESELENKEIVKKYLYKLKEEKEIRRVNFIKRIPNRIGILTLIIMIPIVLLLLYGTQIVNIIN